MGRNPTAPDRVPEPGLTHKGVSDDFRLCSKCAHTHGPLHAFHRFTCTKLAGVRALPNQVDSHSGKSRWVPHQEPVTRPCRAYAP